MKPTIFVIAIALLIGGGFGLRASNAAYAHTQATQLAAAAANQDTQTKLNDLKQYVATHSGATITVQLTAAYNAAVQQAAVAATATATPSSSLYAAAQAACAGHAVSTVQAVCNQAYIESHSTPASASSTVVQPKLSDYTYHFVAPFLTLDLATVLWAIAFVLILIMALPVLRPAPFI
jgi:hypothetical protein